MCFKILILGETKVGKTCFLRQCFDNKFNDKHYETIGVDFKFAEFTHGPTKKKIRLSVWNTAGNWRFAPLGHAFYGNTDVLFLMYDKS